jgi:hypothetical protein
VPDVPEPPDEPEAEPAPLPADVGSGAGSEVTGPVAVPDVPEPPDEPEAEPAPLPALWVKGARVVLELSCVRGEEVTAVELPPEDAAAGTATVAATGAAVLGRLRSSSASTRGRNPRLRLVVMAAPRSAGDGKARRFRAAGQSESSSPEVMGETAVRVKRGVLVRYLLSAGGPADFEAFSGRVDFGAAGSAG